jgi:DNA-binding transcriptional LysR family regulator
MKTRIWKCRLLFSIRTVAGNAPQDHMRHQTTLRVLDAVARAGSIRKAAEQLALTHTALNRRILAFEAELGAPVFERLPRGVRLSPAGELVIHHLRLQLADMERVRSQIADLGGERRGHVAIACSQALLPFFLPREIAAYRARHPAVTFAVDLRDRGPAEQALIDHAADLALVFDPEALSAVQTLHAAPQPVMAVTAAGHPLAAAAGPVRLRDCAAHPLAIPTAPYGVRRLLDAALARTSLKPAAAVSSSSFEFLRNYVRAEPVVTFQIPIGLPPDDPGLAMRPVDPRDMPAGRLHLLQLRGRTLPVAAAKFADQVARALMAAYGA